MVAVLVAQDCVLPLVILGVQVVVGVAPELAKEAVTQVAVAVVTDAPEVVMEAVPEAVLPVALAVARVVLAVVGGGVKEVVELSPIKEGENGKR